MAHTIYENFVLENKIEDMLNTNLDLASLATPDYSLTENAGMVKKINKYTASGDVEELGMGEGNSDDIEVSFVQSEYTVGVTQGRFQYFDEQEMTDSMVVETGLKACSDKMTNDLNSKVIAEMGKGSRVHYGATWSYDDVVDAIADFGEDENGLFILISPAEKAAFRKKLGPSLSFVEANTRTGYIGTICGADVLVSKIVPAGKAYIATKEATKIFVKKGVEIEQERDANTRNNKVFVRKVMLVALVDDTKLTRLSANADPRTGKVLVTVKPDDWASDYASYYKYDAVAETCNACTSADDWAAGLIYEAE